MAKVSSFLIKSLLVLVVSACVWASETEKESSEATLIHAGTLMVEAGEPLKTAVSLLIVEGKIQRLIPGFVDEKQVGAIEKIEVVDLKDKFVMPGLIDTHVHLQLGNSNKKERGQLSDAELTLHGSHSARLTLAAGFTTVRDLGAPNESIFALRDAIAEGLVPGPRVLAAGSSVSITGGHGTVFCDSPHECRGSVRRQIMLGADVIKINATAGGDGHVDDQPEMYEEEMQAAIDAAHRLKRKVAAHAHTILGITQAVELGVDSIEHGTFLDKNAMRLMQKQNIFLVPTLSVRDNLQRDIETMPADLQERVRVILDSTPEVMGQARKAGVKFALGSDAGVVKHGNNARELEWLVDIGMSTGEALKSATVNAAELLGLADQIGTLEVGKQADIIAVKGNPLEDISVMKKVEFVMQAGEVIPL